MIDDRTQTGHDREARPIANFVARILRGRRSEGGDGRWVVLDTETGGLDPDADPLLAIGAVAVHREGIRVGDSFECVLFNDAVSAAENVLVHGIGHDAQRSGEPRSAALSAFLAFVGASPCAAFHADFDRRVLDRAFERERIDARFSRWLDIAPLGAALYPELRLRGVQTLDDWIGRFGLQVDGRHSAAADALAAAELLLRLRAAASAQGARSFESLVSLARQKRWLGNPPD